jgi:hypothetical protein
MTSLLFREQIAEPEEIEAARKVWGSQYYRFRSCLPSGTTAIGRYSVYPYYRELEEECDQRDISLIHSGDFHSFCTEMGWYDLIDDLTPDTWHQKGWKTVPDCKHGWVVKGLTHSRKWQWDDMMYAATRQDLRDVLDRIHRDSRVSKDGVVIREYVPLDKVGEGINGLPLGNEWRFFVLGSEIIASGFYWAIAECAPSMTSVPTGAKTLAQTVARRIQFHTDSAFYTVDIGRTEQGDWIVIEINEGQMSGLCTIPPVDFYEALDDASV